jgi:hypothetical protein
MWNAYFMTNAHPAPVLLWTKGDRLGKALRLADVSNGEMAEVLGVSRNTVGNYIADRTPISDGYIRLWAMRTGVSFEELKYGVVTGRPDPGGSVTRRYRTQHKSHNWGRTVTHLRGTVAATAEPVAA